MAEDEKVDGTALTVAIRGGEPGDVFDLRSGGLPKDFRNLRALALVSGTGRGHLAVGGWRERAAASFSAACRADP